MRIEGKRFEFEDTIVWVFVMHSSVEMVTKRLYLQIGAQKKARFFSLMYFRESLCINRIWHNYVIPQLVLCIIMPFRTSFHIPFRKLIPSFTLTGSENGEGKRRKEFAEWYVEWRAEWYNYAKYDLRGK